MSVLQMIKTTTCVCPTLILTIDYRLAMPNWTPDHSMILSLLLDLVVGNKERIAIRQDFCRLIDSLRSTESQSNIYFTGSKSEGLDLPGSDADFMHDINNNHNMRIIQSLDDYPTTPDNVTIFLMCTENVRPGFALLQLLQNIHVHPNRIRPCLYDALKSISGRKYLSSDLFVDGHYVRHKTTNNEEMYKRQGPSMEHWGKFEDKSGPGTDLVLSIYCDFWPNEAIEWIHRPRNCNWPTSLDISSIVKFGFHLVPVGHTHSDRKQMEWRVSYSLAERTLVWSFNHVQMQCYAIMKIILKEFIKVRCSSQNQVLCSYFVKTFLFWQYEKTELNFWRADNLRECIKFLLCEFSKCIREGVLRHYFVPRFNLLSIKLTRAAQTELLQLLDIIVESDISIFKECATLQFIWFLQVHQDWENARIEVKRTNLKRNDYDGIMNSAKVLNEFFITLYIEPSLSLHFLYKSISEILAMYCRTSLKTIALRKCLLMLIISILRSHRGLGNKGVYELHRIAKNDILSFDVSTCKLWCAILLYKRRKFLSTLDIVNLVLSNIPPYAIFEGADANFYIDIFLNSDTTTIQRARKAWMFEMVFSKYMSDMLPLGLQIELYFCDVTISLSPFTCIYYLQFLCYHGMQQYDRRDRALQQLIETVQDPELYNIEHYMSLNIAGHCLLLAGKRSQARDIFYDSYTDTQRHTPRDKYNSALWYLQNCF